MTPRAGRYTQPQGQIEHEKARAGGGATRELSDASEFGLRTVLSGNVSCHLQKSFAKHCFIVVLCLGPHNPR